MTHELTRDQATAGIIVRAQLLDARRPGDVVEVAEQLGYVKIDPTATIAPCEHTVLWSRIGWSYEPGQLQKAAELDRLLFEFDGAFRPMSLLPAYDPRDEAMAAARKQPGVARRERPLPRATSSRGCRAEGPMLASRDPRHRSGEPGPRRLEGLEPGADHARFPAASGRGRDRRSRGPAPRWDLADRVYPPRPPRVRRGRGGGCSKSGAAGRRTREAHWCWNGVGKTSGEPAVVEGSTWKFRVDPEALAAFDDDGRRPRRVPQPYDSLLFDRKRLEELFGFTYVLEQFKPKPQRGYGYFAHPILMGDRFVGMLDAEVDRAREVLRVNAVTSSSRSSPRSTRSCAPRSANWGMARRHGRRGALTDRTAARRQSEAPYYCAVNVSLSGRETRRRAARRAPRSSGPRRPIGPRPTPRQAWHRSTSRSSSIR